MKYLGRPKVCCGNCQQWFGHAGFSDGRWGKCRAVGAAGHMLTSEENNATSTHENFWCCNFRLKDTSIKLQLTEELELVE